MGFSDQSDLFFGSRPAGTERWDGEPSGASEKRMIAIKPKPEEFIKFCLCVVCGGGFPLLGCTEWPYIDLVSQPLCLSGLQGWWCPGALIPMMCQPLLNIMPLSLPSPPTGFYSAVHVRPLYRDAGRIYPQSRGAGSSCDLTLLHSIVFLPPLSLLLPPSLFLPVGKPFYFSCLLITSNHPPTSLSPPLFRSLAHVCFARGRTWQVFVDPG